MATPKFSGEKFHGCHGSVSTTKFVKVFSLSEIPYTLIGTTKDMLFHIIINGNMLLTQLL